MKHICNKTYNVEDIYSINPLTEKKFKTLQLKHSYVSAYSLQTTYLEQCCVFVER